MTEEKEKRKNETFSIRPSVKILLIRLANYYDTSQGKVIERLIKEKSKKLGINEN